MDQMDLKATHSSTILTDHTHACNSRLCLPPIVSPISHTASAYPSSTLYPTFQRRKALSGMLNESHDGACLDAMKSSSPPHIGLSKDFISDLGIGKNNAAHDAWMFVKLGELYYAGSHGMDIMGPVMKNESIRLAQGRAVCASRPEGLPSFAGHPWAQGTHKTADYQLKGFFLSKLFFASVQVLEVRPAIDWNKGKAVEFLLEYLGLRTSDDVLPIYVGDDRTDEDAFKVSLITFP
ncbi:hypothetical protein GW17_00015145 [Ensete ventricosum]|nr:hypothetical protein GW17_00015145 [Ensete ventricosum]